jgi:hypothetical protein
LEQRVSRLIFLLLVVFLILAVVRTWRRGPRGRGGANSRQRPAEELVEDPQCHKYVPKSEAVLQAGHYFCSQECARLYLSR